MGKGWENIERELRAAGGMPDGDIDIAHVALMLAARDRPELSLAPYRDHLDELVGAARDVDIENAERDGQALSPVDDMGKICVLRVVVGFRIAEITVTPGHDA